MTPKKADCVFAVFLDFPRKYVLMFEVRDGGAWTFPGGEVLANESEEDAVERFALEVMGLDVDVFVVEQLGPLHHFDDGKTAKAFYCYTNAEPVLNDACEQFAQCQFFIAEDLLTAVPVDGAIIERMAWDGLTVVEDPTKGPRQAEHEVQGFYCNSGEPHQLHQEIDDEHRTWPRLSPRDGKPMQAAS